jgi:hypothetical protein
MKFTFEEGMFNNLSVMTDRGYNVTVAFIGTQPSHINVGEIELLYPNDLMNTLWVNVDNQFVSLATIVYAAENEIEWFIKDHEREQRDLERHERSMSDQSRYL